MNKPEFDDGKSQPADTKCTIISNVFYTHRSNCVTFSGLWAPGPGVLELSDGSGPRMWSVKAALLVPYTCGSTVL